MSGSTTFPPGPASTCSTHPATSSHSQAEEPQSSTSARAQAVKASDVGYANTPQIHPGDPQRGLRPRLRCPAPLRMALWSGGSVIWRCPRGPAAGRARGRRHRGHERAGLVSRLAAGRAGRGAAWSWCRFAAEFAIRAAGRAAGGACCNTSAPWPGPPVPGRLGFMTETTGKTCLPCCCAWMPMRWPLTWRPGRWRARHARPADWPGGDTAGNGRSGCAAAAPRGCGRGGRGAGPAAGPASCCRPGARRRRSAAPISPAAPSEMTSSGQARPRSPRSRRNPSHASSDSPAAASRPMNAGLPSVVIPQSASTGSAAALAWYLKKLASRNR